MLTLSASVYSKAALVPELIYKIESSPVSYAEREVVKGCLVLHTSQEAPRIQPHGWKWHPSDTLVCPLETLLHWASAGTARALRTGRLPARGCPLAWTDLPTALLPQLAGFCQNPCPGAPGWQNKVPGHTHAAVGAESKFLVCSFEEGRLTRREGPPNLVRGSWP